MPYALVSLPNLQSEEIIQMKSDLEVPLLAIAGVVTMGVFDTWFGRLFTATLFLVAVIRIIQWIKAWNYPKQRRKEEHKEHEIRMKLLEKELKEKERKEQEDKNEE